MSQILAKSTKLLIVLQILAAGEEDGEKNLVQKSPPPQKKMIQCNLSNDMLYPDF